MATAIDKAAFTEQRFDYTGGRPNAPELTLTVGISGCGKSTYTKSQVNWHGGKIVRLNRDDFRKMLFVDVPYNNKNEDYVRNLQMEAARMALLQGRDVIIDDTNCVRNTRQKWEEFAKTMLVNFRLVTFTVPIDECIARDKKRGEVCAACGKPNGVMVGAGIIKDQQKKLTEFKMSNQEKAAREVKITRPYLERHELLKNGGFLPRLPGRPWVLVDVDGTVADHNGQRGPFEEHKVDLDNPREFVISIVQTLYPFFNICIVSGRHDFCGDMTCDWLDVYGCPYDHILMRNSGDNRSDAIVKEEILKELQAVIGQNLGYFNKNEADMDDPTKPIFNMPSDGIAFVLDDRPRVIRMWKSMGVTVFPVRGGTVHVPNCAYAEGETGYRECPDCGALEDF